MTPVVIDPSDFPAFTVYCEHRQTGVGLSAIPLLTRRSVADLVRWLWRIDLEKTYEEDQGSPRLPYLLDDLMKVLAGGVFSIAYPTDYGKSTLVDMSVVLSLLFHPERTLNTIVKADKGAAVAAASVVYWKLTTASEFLSYAKPMAGIRNGNPEVGQGFWIAGSTLRTFGGRDRSVYAAGIADSSLPGRRGRAHFDDLETENVVKSAAKMDTLRKQLNSCIRLLQKETPLFLVAGTPQGANSIMYVVEKAMQQLPVHSEFIRRPKLIEEGDPRLLGQQLWPANELKAQLQRALMTPAAYKIAYELKPPGGDRYDGRTAAAKLKDSGFPICRTEAQLKQFLYARRYQLLRLELDNPPAQPRPGLGVLQGMRGEFDVQRRCEAAMNRVRIYAGWDPATVGTHALHLVAFESDARWVLASQIDSDTEDQQAMVIRDWRKSFPSLFAVIENDGQQRAFGTVLGMVDPNCPYDFHASTRQNTRDDYYAGLPVMMAEMMAGLWHLPWPDDDEGEELFGNLLGEVLRWGPVDHPHGLPSLWFPWHYEGCAQDVALAAQRRDTLAVDPIGQVQDAGALWLQQFAGGSAVRPESVEAWSRRWPRYR